MAHDVSHAAQRLQTISVDGYAAGHNQPGMCLRWSYFAYDLKPNLTPASIAMDAWTNAPAEHRHAITADTVVPAGLPIILGPSPTRTDGNRNAGDVFPALGSGAGLANLGPMTDSPRLGTGRIGIATLSERAIQTRRPVLGYLTKWLGYDLSATVQAATTPSLANAQENDMTNLRLIRNATKGDANYTRVHLICVETGLDWHVPNGSYVEAIEKVYGIETEDLAANWWGFWRNLATGQRDALGAAAATKTAAAVWATVIDGYNGKHRADERLAGIDKKAGTASVGSITIPDLIISGKAVAA